MCTATETSPLELANTPAICEQLAIQRAKLPIEYIPAIAAMQIAESRLRGMYQDAIADRAVEGWAGWLRIADGWLIKVTEDDDGVWLMLRGPESSTSPSGRSNFEAVAFRKEPTSAQANMLRKLRKTLREAP